MKWHHILKKTPPVARVLLIYVSTTDEFSLALWDGSRFTGYDTSENIQGYSVYWSKLTPPKNHQTGGDTR